MNSKRRGWIWISTGIVLAMIATVMTIKALSMATAIQAGQAKSQQLAVVVAKVDIPHNVVIAPDMVTIKEVPLNLLPKGAIVNVNDVYGKILTQDAIASEIIVRDRLIAPTKQINAIGINIPRKHVIIALPASDLLSSVGALSPGDHVDILFTLNTGNTINGNSQVTIDAMQNLVIRAIIAPSTLNKAKTNIKTATTIGRALLFAVSPQDALTIKYLKDSGAIMEFALRSPDDNAESMTDGVDLPYIFDVYGLEQAAPPVSIPGLPTPVPGK